ncbi:MAG: F0F1 ATP synthase subunit epsilon [Bacillota bacterium]
MTPAGSENIRLEVITPERVVLGENTESIVVPGARGYLGILPGHAPMVVSLKIGLVKYKQGGTYRRLAVSGGFFEVAGDKAVILAETAERGEEVDVGRARAALERARKRMTTRRDGNVDLARAETSLQRALTRLRAAGAAPEKVFGQAERESPERE